MLHRQLRSITFAPKSSGSRRRQADWTTLAVMLGHQKEVPVLTNDGRLRIESSRVRWHAEYGSDGGLLEYPGYLSSVAPRAE